jgi:hypothetical protein
MQSPFYNDIMPPFISGDIGQVTLATTAKALYGQSNFPVLGGNFFGFIGRAIRIELWGRITTAATPGNGSFDIYYGSGADANGTILASSAALALSINQTSVSWMAVVDVHCRTIGNAGTLFCTGYALFNVGVLASTLSPMFIPANTAVVSAGIDLTAANIISVQFKRSGSTAETMQIHNMRVIALN